MDPTFVKLRDSVIPKFNPVAAGGVAVDQMKHALSYIDQIWKFISKDFPEGLVYLGYEICSPTEEYKQGAKKVLSGKTNRKIDTKIKKTPKLYFDLSRSDVYLVKFFFRYKGEDLAPKYVYMPFVNPGGLIYIAGSRFSISPILKDIIISPSKSGAFVGLLMIKINLERLDYVYNQDGKNKIVRVIWSDIYQKEKEKARPLKMNVCLAHYLFCQYGVRGTFDRYLGIEYVLGTDDINRDNYPIEEWVICESRGIKPLKNVSLEYIKPEIKIAIKRKDVTQHVESLVGALFYILDHFPKRLILKNIDNEWLWKVLMGHIIWSPNMNEGLMYDKVSDHFKSIDQYMDPISQKKLADIGIHVNNTYDFFMNAIENCNNWILRDQDKSSTMYGKELALMVEVMLDISKAIAKVNFALQTGYRRYLSDPTKPFTIRNIEEIFKKILRPGLVFSITNSSTCPSISSFSLPGDNMAFKLTSNLIPQNSAIRKQKDGAKRDSNDSAYGKTLDASIAEVGGFMNVQKKAPSGRTRLNVYTNLDERYVTTPSEKFKELIKSTQDLIKGR